MIFYFKLFADNLAAISAAIWPENIMRSLAVAIGNSGVSLSQTAFFDERDTLRTTCFHSC